MKRVDFCSVYIKSLPISSMVNQRASKKQGGDPGVGSSRKRAAPPEVSEPDVVATDSDLEGLDTDSESDSGSDSEEEEEYEDFSEEQLEAADLPDLDERKPKRLKIHLRTSSGMPKSRYQDSTLTSCSVILPKVYGHDPNRHCRRAW